MLQSFDTTRDKKGFSLFGVVVALGVLALAIEGAVAMANAGPNTNVSLTVTEWSNIDRINEPVTSGVPIPADATGASWALFDGVQEIPLQTKVLPGLKTPWLLLDFQSTNAANQVKNYELKQQTPTAAPNQPVTVSEDTNQITVKTGPIQTQLSKTDFNLLGTVWRDQDGDAIFEAGEEVVSPSAGNLTVTDVSVPNGGSGLVYSSVVQPSGFTWEYQGPLRSTLRVDGSYKNTLSSLPNQTLLDFTTRITWYAGQTYVKIEHLIRNSYAPKERWVKLVSAKLNAGTSTTTDRIARSGDTIWSNRSAGTSLELIPSTLDISDEYDPYGSPPVERIQYQPPVNIDSNGGMIIGDQSRHGATVQLDFAATLSGAEATRRTKAAKDPMIALAPEAQYSDLSAFGAERFGTYTDEKNTYTKWGWMWPNSGSQYQWSEEHNRPRVQDMYITWSTTQADDFEADELWQNIMMLARVRIPFYLDRIRSFARFWNWEWTYRSDNYIFNGSSWHWFYGNGINRTPAIQPTLTAADSDFINHNVKFAKADTTHVWNGGSLDYYYLTGDKDSLQAAIDLAEQCKLTFFGPNYNHTVQNTSVTGTGSRGTIRCLQIFTRTWEATNDPQWKTAADGMLPFFLQSIGYDQRGFFYSQPCALRSNYCQGRETGKSFNGFPTAVAVEALYRYYLLTNNQSVKTQILQISQFMRDNALDPVSGFGGVDYIIDAPNQGDVYRIHDIYGRSSRDFVNTMVIGYRLTGDSSYLTKAKLAWGRGTKGAEGSEYATDMQVGRWENSLQAWGPYSGLFPEGGDLTYASFLFYDAALSDTTSPTVMILVPPNGATVSGTIAVTASASDNVGVVGVQLLLDDTNFWNESMTTPYIVTWNTRSATNGTHTLVARARDAAGNQTRSATTTVTVSNSALCAENWTCTGWSACSSAGKQTRTCNDQNSCGTTAQRPPLTQACTPPTVGFTAPPLLAVSLNPFPSMGSAPLTVTLRANVSGTSVGNITYTFYCNRTDSGVQVTASSVARVESKPDKIWTVKDACTYSSAGSYTAKVIVESNRNVAEGRAIISVGPPGSIGTDRLTLLLTQNLFLGMMRHADVERLQEFLKQLGYFPATQETTTFFGKVTMGAVQGYQRAYSIVSSGDPWSTGYGSVGPRTRAHMAQGVTPRESAAPQPSRLFRSLRQGMSGDDVSYLQEKLKSLGFFPATQGTTGYFGILTEEAVKKFQCARGIICSGDPATTGYGLVGPKTLTALEGF